MTLTIPPRSVEQLRFPPRTTSSDNRFFHPDLPAYVGSPHPGPGHTAAKQKQQQDTAAAPALFNGGLPELSTYTAACKENPGAASCSRPDPWGPGAGGQHTKCPAVRSGAHGGGRALCQLHRTGRSSYKNIYDSTTFLNSKWTLHVFV